MGSPTCLISPDLYLVADTSVMINLNSSGFARDIIQALPNKVIITDAVQIELEAGRDFGWPDADFLAQYVDDGLIEVVELSEIAAQKFEKMVAGPAIMTLDDGEASTIAYSDVHNGIALIDERKANRICRENYPALSVRSTVDLFKHSYVQNSLGNESLANSVFNALFHGKMRVFPHHLDWVVKLIGHDKATMCNSLPRAARYPNAS